jgi:hypothetical protein
METQPEIVPQAGAQTISQAEPRSDGENLPEVHFPMSAMQLELLSILSFNPNEEDLRNIRQLIAEYYAEKATAAMEKFEEENNITPETYIAWSKEHMRTPYRPAQNGLSV